MIHIPNKYEEVQISIPRNENAGPEFTLLFKSEMTFKSYEFEVIDSYSSKNYYKFTIDPQDIEDGEYRYFLKDGETLVAEGLAQIGEVSDQTPVYVFFDGFYNRENVQYYPQPILRTIRIEAPSDIPYSSTTLDFNIYGNVDWSCTVYKRGSQVGETVTGTSRDHFVSIPIEPNETDENWFYDIAAGDLDATVSDEARVLQWGLPFSVSVTANTPIAASSTTIPYTVTYSQYNSYRIGTAYLYKDGELNDQVSFGSYPYGFSSAFTIEENTSTDPVSYVIDIVLPATPNAEEVSASTEVIQTAVEPEPVYSKKRFTIEMLENGNINWEGRGYEYYDIIRNGVRDEGNQLDHGVFDLQAGDIVEFYLRTDNTNPIINIPITSRAKHNVYGNIMSLLYVDFEDKTTIPQTNQFELLFYRNSGLVNAENLILPATALTNNCYLRMFDSCTSLTTAPELPATALADSCYYGMFEVCTSLETAPALPATALAELCYYNMFNGCTNLSKAPDLPSLQLALGCYSAMFVNCTSLTEAPELPATTLANSCYANMFDGCTSLTTAPALPSQSPVMECYSGMFARCTSLTTAPELPADNMVRECYEYMFYGCTNLNYIKCLASYDIGLNGSTSNWVKDVSSSGTFVMKAQSLGWEVGDDGIPNGWTVENVNE